MNRIPSKPNSIQLRTNRHVDSIIISIINSNWMIIESHLMGKWIESAQCAIDEIAFSEFNDSGKQSEKYRTFSPSKPNHSDGSYIVPHWIRWIDQCTSSTYNHLHCQIRSLHRLFNCNSFDYLALYHVLHEKHFITCNKQ